MNQLYLRKVHKTIGIVLALFIFLQAGTGLFLSFSVTHSHAHSDAVTIPNKHEEKPLSMAQGKTIEPQINLEIPKETEPTVHLHEEESDNREGMLQLVHHGGGFIGSIYRILLASGFLFMTFSGALIFYLTKKATRQ